MKSKIALLLSVFILTVISCEKKADPVLVMEEEPLFMDLSAYYAPSSLKSTAGGAAAPTNLAVLMAEYLTAGESGMMGRTVYFMNVGNKQLAGHFAAIPDLALDGTLDVSYYIDETRPSADLSVSASSAAIQRAMETWNGITCSDLGMFRAPSASAQTGFVAALFGFGGSFDYFADVVHSGWLPREFFDLLDTDGGDYILGVTFTIVFTDDDGNLIDLDKDKKYDVAWREIYFNDKFTWNIDAHYDVETVALHEAGHGLSQGHFGTAFRDAGSGALHFSPRAVMNAAYSGIQTEIQFTDNAGHCSIWASWSQE